MNVSINVYEVAVRSWTNSGRALSDRIAVTDKLAMDITMAWELDPEMKRLGSWKNADEVSEEIFISFLRSMRKRTQRMASQLTNFSNFLIQNPIRFILEDEASLWSRVSEYRLEWEKLPKDQITETWEKEQVSTVLRTMLLEGNKGSAERFVNDMTRGEPKPTKFVPLMTLLVQYHREILNSILKIETYKNPRAGDSRPNSSFGTALPAWSRRRRTQRRESLKLRGAVRRRKRKPRLALCVAGPTRENAL
jgi:hypothetical protein